MNHTLRAGTILGHPMQNKFSNPTHMFLVHKYPHHPSYSILRFKPILISRTNKESRFFLLTFMRSYKMF